MEAPARKQTAAHRSSHSEDGVGEGGWDGYPSDQGLQTALQKLHVRHSDDRGQAEEDSLASGASDRPISYRTKAKERSRRGEASQGIGDDGVDERRQSNARNDDADVGVCADGGDATHNNEVNVTQRSALHSKSKNTLQVWTPHFQILDSTFSFLDYTVWLDSTLKICPVALVL